MMRVRELIEARGKVVVIGAGGHAKVVLRALQEELKLLGVELKDVAILLDDDPDKHGTELYGLKVIGSSSMVDNLEVIAVHVAIGDNKRRMELYRRFNLARLTVVHPTSVIEGEVGAGSFIGPMAYVGVNAQVGEGVIVNTKASIDHDCLISDWAHLAPSSTLGGEVKVGEGTLIGIGSTVLPRVKVGSWSIIGAGSVVVRDVPSGVKAWGVPATVKSKIG